jgi:hypothetical protein
MPWIKEHFLAIIVLVAMGGEIAIYHLAGPVTPF